MTRSKLAISDLDFGFQTFGVGSREEMGRSEFLISELQRRTNRKNGNRITLPEDPTSQPFLLDCLVGTVALLCSLLFSSLLLTSLLFTLFCAGRVTRSSAKKAKKAKVAASSVVSLSTKLLVIPNYEHRTPNT